MVALLAIGLGGYAQETSLASGGEAIANDGKVSYSIGQTFYTSASGGDGSVAQGVQQAPAISDVSVFEDVEAIGLTAFPNPTTDYVVLDVANSAALSYQLYNLKGELLKENEVTQNQAKVSLAGLPAGSYLLKVADEKKAIKVFKIVKN